MRAYGITPNCIYDPAFRKRLAASHAASRDSSPEHRNPRRGKKRKYGEGAKIGKRVLMVGSVRELALYRAEVLSKAGFVVSTPEEVEDALEIVQRQNFDVIVLSYTLTSESVQRLADTAREHCPDCPIVSITRTHVYDRLIAPDAVVIADEGPPALLAALNRVLQIN